MPMSAIQRVDLHIHTIATKSDPQSYVFNIDVLKNYIDTAKLNAIAITNHNCFDMNDYVEVSNTVGIPVFPGTELNITKPGGYGHVLVIAPPEMVDQFALEISVLAQSLQEPSDHMRWEDAVEVMKGIGNYIVIPHYRKKKHMGDQAIDHMREVSGIDALEVSGNKKWLVENGKTKEPLVCFSDSRPGLRMREDDENVDQDTKRYAYGFTYIKCDNANVQEIKQALKVKGNVHVIRPDADFEILPESLPVSRRLNVVLGNRSAGKSYTLKRILDAYGDDCAYIEQFSITERAKRKNFEEATASDDRAFEKEHLALAQELINDYCAIDVGSIACLCEAYCQELVTYANSSEDDYSKCPVYSAQPYTFERSFEQEEKDVALRRAAYTLANESSRAEIVAKYFNRDSLSAFDEAIRNEMWKAFIERHNEELANELIEALKEKLQENAARKPLPSREPMKQFFRECYREHRLAALLDGLCKTAKLKDEPAGSKFKKRRTRCVCENATEARKRIASIPKGTDINGLFKVGATGVERLRIMRGYDEILQGNALRLLLKVETRILNNDAIESDLSGGQRAEYLFLNELAKARGKDIVLIDEPESSFDNLFLSKEIVTQLQSVAESATVFLATHNNALGVSLEPDCIIYAEKEGGNYRLYSGALSATNLMSPDGASVSRVEVLLNTMEAGRPAYERRKVHYGLT